MGGRVGGCVGGGRRDLRAVPLSLPLTNATWLPLTRSPRLRLLKAASGGDADAALNRTSAGGAAATSPVGSPGGAAAGGAAASQAPPAAQQLTLPLFVMSLMMPGETMALNIFEPRYRLMVRRVMEGSRRLGMAQVGGWGQGGGGGGGAEVGGKVGSGSGGEGKCVSCSSSCYIYISP